MSAIESEPGFPSNAALMVRAMKQSLRESIAKSSDLPNLGFNRDGTPNYNSFFYGPPAAALRPSGLPPIGALPRFIFEVHSNSAFCPNAIHEAGHAAVALLCGIEVHGIGFVNGCAMHHGEIHDKKANQAVTAAGLLSEILIYGSATAWQSAITDLKNIAHAATASDGGVAQAMSKLWARVGLPELSRFTPAQAAVTATTSFSDFDFECAIRALPATLAIAEVVIARLDACHDMTDGRDIEFIFDAVMEQLRNHSGDADYFWPSIPDRPAMEEVLKSAESAPHGHEAFYYR